MRVLIGMQTDKVLRLRDAVVRQCRLQGFDTSHGGGTLGLEFVQVERSWLGDRHCWLGGVDLPGNSRRFGAFATGFGFPIGEVNLLLDGIGTIPGGEFDFRFT